MSDYARQFWLECDRYHDLAKDYERAVSVTHPSGHFECELNGMGGHCPFCATSVAYYEYTGGVV